MTNRLHCPICGIPTIEDTTSDLSIEEYTCDACLEAQEWTGEPDPDDPDNYWIDDKTGERVNALTGERTKP